MAAVDTAFYCVSDSRYFLGAVGLVNSLRLLGHREPIHLLDCGLRGEQRELLGPHVNLVKDTSGTPPWLLKTIAPAAHPAEVMVLVDADVIAVRPLSELIERARETGVVAFANNMDRFVSEWGELLDLGPVRQGPYLCSAFVAMADDPGAEILKLMESRQRQVDFSATHWRANSPDYPFLYADQDVLNAILAARVAPQRVIALDHRLAPSIPFEGLRVSDANSLRCRAADGREPFLLHQSLSPKPWQAPGFDGVYSQLLRRLLCGADVAVRVPREQVPLRLRTGALADAERKRVHLVENLRWRVRGLLRERFGDEARDGGARA